VVRRAALAAVPAALVLGVALLGDRVTPHDPARVVDAPYAPPGGQAPLGTDALGRDVLSRVLAGGDLVTLALVAALAACALGVAAGLFAGWSDHWTRRLVTGAADVLLATPLLLLALLLAVALPGDAAVVAATVCGGAPLTLRVVQDATRSRRGAGYVEAAQARGERGATLLLREVLPSLAGVVAADVAARFTAALHVAAALGLLGFGAQPPTADWALMIRENLPGAGLNAAGVIAPAAALALVALAVTAAARLAVAGPHREVTR
jgi:peptide/nickel transport system permease protein